MFAGHTNPNPPLPPHTHAHGHATRKTLLCCPRPRAAREREMEVREKMRAVLVDRKGARVDRCIQWLGAAAVQGHALAASLLSKVLGEAEGLVHGAFPVVGPRDYPHLALPNPVVGDPKAAPFFPPVVGLAEAVQGQVATHLGTDSVEEREGLGRLHAGDSYLRGAYRTVGGNALARAREAAAAAAASGAVVPVVAGPGGAGEAGAGPDDVVAVQGGPGADHRKQVMEIDLDDIFNY